MKLTELSQMDIDLIKSIHNSLTSEKRDIFLAEHFGINQRTVRNWVSKLGIARDKVEATSEQLQAAKVRELKQSKYYLITAAQNATPVHANLFANMQKYANHIGAEICVIPYRYKNPTSTHTELQHDVWESILTPYLDLNRHKLNDNLVLLSDFKVQPTASNPLDGLEGITGNKSAIIGHSRQHGKSLPVIAGNHVKALFTTGACTIENYTDSKAGKIGEFHHVLGFCIVEVVDNEIFHIRHVSADSDGNFIDLVHEVKDGIIYRAEPPKALVMADLHSEVTNKEVFNSTLLHITKLLPESIYLHDVADGLPVNPHEKENYVLRVKRYNEGKHLVKDSIQCIIGKVKEIQEAFAESKIHVVRSNHDEFFDRWVNSHNWKNDIPNAQTYLELASMAIKSDIGIIPTIITEATNGAVNCLGYNESHKVMDIELSLHGHAGNNGAKGSIAQFRKLSNKGISAHNHGFAVLDGWMQVGSCTDRFQHFNKGTAGAAHAHAIITNNGKRQLLILSGGSFSTFL